MSFLATVAHSLWVWGVTALLILCWLPALALVRLLDRDPLALRTARVLRVLGRMIIRAQFPKLTISGMGNARPHTTYLIVCNHQSSIDVPLASFVPVDCKFLGKDVLFRIPVVGWMMRMSKDVPVSRADTHSAARALIHCAKLMRDGCSVLVFPEGTRSYDGNLLPFSDAPFKVAIRQGVSILPVVLDGTGSYLPRSAFLFSERCPIHFSILPPVSVEGCGLKGAPELAERVRNLMTEELARIRKSD